MPDFRVVLDDLAALQKNFADEATTYEQLIPSINPPAVDGGDGNLNSVLTALHETFDVAHHNLASSIHHHADILKERHDTFQRSDSGGFFQWYDGTRALYDNMVPKDEQP
jgi:hypothetical protein